MLEKLKLKKQSPNQDQKNNKKKLSKQAIVSIVVCSFLVLTHVAIILAIIMSFRYYSIYPSLFGSVVAIVLCILIIIDIIFFVGFNHKDLALKLISCTLSVLMLLGGSVGTYFIARANGIVDSVLDNGSQKYETYAGIFVCYDKNNKFTSLEELKGKKIGMLAETTNGTSYVAKGELSNAKVDYELVEYKTNAELVTSLLDNNVDAIVITSTYRTLYSLERDENSPFAQYLDNFIDFYSFEKELKVSSDRKTKNLSTDPFNVLLIGYSRTDIGSTVGLADSIIVATINPQTYTVSMMSIARDSFVPISCYGGEYDKINSGRSTSRACFIETVEDFLDMEIDFYMELDYLGLAAIVNTIDGVEINNPVDFTLDGVYVPAGQYIADGMQALQFCRERHSMPNGDFDRQQHQKEVIIGIAKKLIESRDIDLALDCMNNAAEWMSTDLTLNQLTSIFNLLLNTKNYTGLDTFDLIDFQTLRITGSGGIKYYSMSMRLPLWVYLIYQGSYDESMEHLNAVMGNYKSISQDYSFEFSATCPYTRAPLYSEEYDDVFMFTPEEMPPYWANLEGMSVAEAMAWASEHNVTLTISETINASDPRYNAELEGTVYEQSVRYGSLISEVKEGTIIVMGAAEIDENKVVPDFVGHSYTKAKSWANDHGIYCDITFSTSVSGEVGDVVSQDPKPYTDIEDCDVLEIVVKAGEFKVKFDKNGHGKDSEVPNPITVKTGDSIEEFSSMSSNTEDDVKYIFTGWYTSAGSNGTKVSNTGEVKGVDGSTITLYAHWSKLYTVTFDNDGSKITKQTTEDFPANPTKKGYIFDGWNTKKDGKGTKVLDFSSITSSVTVYAIWTECKDHTYGEGVITTKATCTTDGEKTFTCTKCSSTKTEVIAATGHTETDVAEVPATCEHEGTTAGKKCSVCGAILSGCETIGIKDHTYGEPTVVPATCTSDGYTSKVCTVCGHEEKSDKVSAGTDLECPVE